MKRFFDEIALFIRGVWKNLKNAESEVLLFLLAAILGTGTIAYHYLEGWNFLDALYFCVVTLTTVGYGDYAPVTPLGKLFTIFYILVGIVFILGFVNSIIKQSIEDQHMSQVMRDAEFYRELREYKPK